MEPPPPVPVVADAAVARGSTDVRVDKRVELISILHRYGGGNEYRLAPANAYVVAVDKAFGPFKDHPAVRATAQLRAKHGISFDAPIIFAVHLDDKLELVNAAELPLLDARWKGVDVEAYAKLVREFARDTKLDEFVEAHRELYAQKAKQLRDLVDAENPVGFFDTLFGQRTKTRYIVVPGLLNGTRNFGVRATLPDGTEEMYQVLGDHGGAPDLALLVHEMAHSYVNPIFERHHAQLAAAGESLYAHVAEAMRAQHYVSWQTLLNESGVRAVVVLFMRERKGDVVAATQARSEIRASFLWIHELEEVFRKYTRDRATYSTFDAYMPKVIAFFDALAKQYAKSPPKMPFIGPFDAVLRSDYALVLPNDGAAATYAKKLPFFANKQIASDIVDGKSIVAYGTPESNPAVAKAAAWAIWKITPDGIELGDKKFAGKNLVLVACWFRRDDPSRGIAVYAATNEADLVGINHGLKHGTRDWLVAKKTAKGYEVVETGDWNVENGAWVPFVSQ